MNNPMRTSGLLPFLAGLALAGGLAGYGLTGALLDTGRTGPAMPTYARLGLDIERWVEQPLIFLVTFDAEAMRAFVSGRESLLLRLDKLDGRGPKIEEAVAVVREWLPRLANAAQSVTQATRGEQETAGRTYLALAGELRGEIARLADAVGAAQRSEAAAAGAMHSRKLVIGLVGLALLAVWLTAWLVILRARLLRWFRALAGLTTPHIGALEPAPGAMAADRAVQAVNALVSRLVEQQHGTEFHIRQQDMLREFTEALETTDDEDEVTELFLRMLRLRHPHTASQVLITDPSRATLRPVLAETPDRGCAPGHPNRCKALRLGRALRVDDPGSLAACPRMSAAVTSSYACIPLTIAGRSAATLRMVSHATELDVSEVVDSASVAQRFAVRLGVLRLLAQTARQARTDPLTGLDNRRVITDRLRELIGADPDNPGCDVPHMAVMMLDLDHFKQLNDAHGHGAGDNALRAFVRVTSAALPEGAIFGRIGGEEFTVAAPAATAAEAIAIAQRVADAVRAHVALATEPATTVSIGVALAPLDGRTVQELLSVADGRLYRAKEEGRDRVVGPRTDVVESRLQGEHEPACPPAAKPARIGA